MALTEGIEVRPLTGTIGAEVLGADLRKEISDSLAATLRDLLARHQVIVLRDQFLDIPQQKALTRVFGAPMRLPYIEPLAEDPEVVRVYRSAEEGGGVFGGDWHSDVSFLERPPSGSILCAEIVPDYGGDTVWASQAAAWDALPSALQDVLLSRAAIHVGKPYGVKWAPPLKTQTGGGKGGGVKMMRGDPAADEERAHPAVLCHPVTGRRLLYLNPTYVVRLADLTEAESRPILDQVQRHVTRPEFCCRLRWAPGTVTIWDNFATQHYAVNDYQSSERLMYRTAFSGPCPAEMAAA